MNATSTHQPSDLESAVTPVTLTEPGFYHLQAGELHGPLDLSQLRQRVAYYQILDEDTLIYMPGQITLPGKMINLLAPHLKPDDVIEWIDDETIITRRGVLTGNRLIPYAEISRFEILQAKWPEAPIRHPLGKILVWMLAILFCWTIIAPIQALRLTSKPAIDPRFHPSVNGIRLHGFFEKTIIAETLGFYSDDAPEIESLRNLYGLLVKLHHEATSAAARPTVSPERIKG